MRMILLTILLLSQTSTFAQRTSTKIVPVPAPPTVEVLPDVDVISSILTSPNSLADIRKLFDAFENSEELDDAEYNEVDTTLSDMLHGVWGRFYTQTTSLFNIPAVSEEILCFTYSGAMWIQDVKTTATLHSKSRRKLQVAYYDLFGHTFIVFYYEGQNPEDQTIRDKQGFFVKILPDKSYMQMSPNPDFDVESSMFWRFYPKANFEGALELRRQSYQSLSEEKE